MAAELRQKVLFSKVLRKVAKQSEGLFRLPESLRSAIAAFIADYPSQEVKRNVARLSVALRKRDPKLFTGQEIEKNDPDHELLESMVRSSLKDSQKELVSVHSAVTYEEGHTAAYVASRMPSVYASIYRVLYEVFRRIPDFKPATMLDYGSGPGTAFWALHAVWPDAVVQANAVESSRAMAFACRRLLQDKKVAPSIRYYKNLQDLQRSLPQDERGHDLVISSYALGESPTTKERISTIRQLWALTRDILVLIEPGTPQGSKLIRESRAHILALEKKRFLRQKVDGDVGPERGDVDKKRTSVKQHTMLGNAFVVAPCPHDGVCPMDKTDQWCHFIQRLERTPSQRTTKRLDRKGALRGYEDEKFSFVVLRRGIRPRVPWPLDGVELKLSEDEQQQEQEFKVDDYDSQSDGNSSSEELSSIQTAEDQSDAEESEASSDGKGYGSDDKLNTVTTVGDQSDDEESEATSGEGGKQGADLGSGWARIVFAPIRRGKHVFLDVCCSTKKDGSEGKIDRLIVSRSQNAVLHRQAKKSRWGDLWPSR